MARRLPTIAAWINTNMTGYEATIIKISYSTDSKVGRLRAPGKDRDGNKLVVKKDGVVVLSHNSAETYRKNEEVEQWIKDTLKSDQIAAEKAKAVQAYKTNTKDLKHIVKTEQDDLVKNPTGDNALLDKAVKAVLADGMVPDRDYALEFIKLELETMGPHYVANAYGVMVNDSAEDFMMQFMAAYNAEIGATY